MFAAFLFSLLNCLNCQSAKKILKILFISLITFILCHLLIVLNTIRATLDPGIDYTTIHKYYSCFLIIPSRNEK